MRCGEAQKQLVELLDSAAQPELRAHLAECRDCAREYEALRATIAAIEPPVRVRAPADFQDRILAQLAASPAPASRRRAPRWTVIAVTAALLVVLAPVLGSLGRPAAPVLTLLAQSASAMADLRSMHFEARMRTRPAENFEFISPDCGWVPLEIWKEFGERPKWRVEKPGRVVVMDGDSALLWIKPDHAKRGTPRTNFLEWLNLLLEPDKIMENELRMARFGLVSATVTDAPGGQLVLTVHRRWFGLLSDNLFRDNIVSASDHTRVYRFDAATKRLEGLELILHSRSGDISVFEITRIEYGESFDPGLFSLVLPENAILYVSPAQMPGAPPPSARDAAVIMFEGLAREDWNQVLSVYPYSGLSPDFKTSFGGLQIISIGQPFRSFWYAGQLVPYEVRLRSGRVIKHNLAVRNDNTARRWVCDGGL